MQVSIAELFFVTGMVEQLLANDVYIGDAMLRAVDVGFVETVEKITSHAAQLRVGLL